MARVDINLNSYSNQDNQRQQNNQDSSLLWSLIRQEEQERKQEEAQARSEIARLGEQDIKNADTVGLLNVYTDESPTLAATLEKQQRDDAAFSTWVLSKGTKFSLQDSKDMWDYYTARNKQNSELLTRGNAYQKALDTRAKINEGQQTAPIFALDEINAEMFFNGDIPQNATTYVSGTTLEQEMSNLTQSLLNQVEETQEYKDAKIKGLIDTIKSRDVDVNQLLEYAMNSDTPLVRAWGKDIYTALTNAANSLRDTFNYTVFSDNGKELFDNAIYRGVLLGLTGTKTATRNDPRYSKPSTKKTTGSGNNAPVVAIPTSEEDDKTADKQPVKDATSGSNTQKGNGTGTGGRKLKKAKRKLNKKKDGKKTD